MKIQFDKHSYLEIMKQDDKVIIVIQALDANNTLKTVCNACELTVEQFKSMCDELQVL